MFCISLTTGLGIERRNNAGDEICSDLKCKLTAMLPCKFSDLVAMLLAPQHFL